MRTKGKITSWNDEKGYGFITPGAGGKQVFIHIKAFSRRNRRPAKGQLVSYSLSSDKQGRPCASNATLAGDRIQGKPNRKNVSLTTVIAASFLVIVAISVVTGKLPPVVLALYAVASLLTFIMYAKDKSAARNGASRTPENTLHLLSLAGGWPGALIAQKRFRHKTKKQSFRSVFWITTLLNCGVFAWLCMPSGAAALRTLIDITA